MEVLFLVLALFGIIIFLSLFTYFIPVGLWISAYFAGVRVAIFKDLVGMRLRKVRAAPDRRPPKSAPLRRGWMSAWRAWKPTT